MSKIDLTAWPLRERGTYFEDHVIGRSFDHHWGRTIHASDNIEFSTQMLAFNPEYFNREVALERGHRDEVVNPLLVFGVVFGLSVEDLSEAGGPFLGGTDVTYHRSVYPGETLYARSTVVDARTSTSRPGAGIVTWHTEGRTADGEVVIDFHRTNLVRRRPAEQNLAPEFEGYAKDFIPGAKFRHARTRTVTDLDLNGFTLLVMNSAVGHFSDGAMADSEFGERINFGGMSLSLTIGLATQDTSGQAIREVGMTDIKFPAPVKRGDTIGAATEVLDVAADGVVTFRHIGVNQRGDLVVQVTRRVQLKHRP
ncbi:MaoC family dehydratase [Tsukamurella sp. DT100]|uniref:MaoC family dehydratase n=1 Tax=Tsukamurella sp. DT100 TaxID=3393415 RepID=UPI003CF879BE